MEGERAGHGDAMLCSPSSHVFLPPLRHRPAWKLPPSVASMTSFAKDCKLRLDRLVESAIRPCGCRSGLGPLQYAEHQAHKNLNRCVSTLMLGAILLSGLLMFMTHSNLGFLRRNTWSFLSSMCSIFCSVLAYDVLCEAFDSLHWTLETPSVSFFLIIQVALYVDT
ncbi:unnamed protein product [Polarella glacialis]|uniref:Uncharacterized protein n=1 Tax=Polarella glacialis TaxID=89957 RepID=A0A813HML3_POLGL|nr:unnamed protein product [Polarella glacialis]